MNRVLKNLLISVLAILVVATMAGPNLAQPRRVMGIAMPTTPPNLVHIPT